MQEYKKHLNRFKKAAPETAAAKVDIVDMFLKELTTDNQASQLDGIRHLQEMRDPRIVPALDNLLFRSRSDEVIEAVVTAMSRQKDPRAIPALRKAAAGVYDFFLKLTIGEAQLNVGDAEGYATLINIMKEDDAGYARHQANELLQKRSGQKFGYNPDLPVAFNRAALTELEAWYAKTGSRAKIVGRHPSSAD